MPRPSDAYPIGALLPPGAKRIQSSPTHRAAPSQLMPAQVIPARDQIAREIGIDFVELLVSVARKCRDAAPRVRAFGTAWVNRTRSLWQGGTRSGKLLAVLTALGGIAALVVFAYLAVILLPIMIFGAFVAAVLAGLGMRR